MRATFSFRSRSGAAYSFRSRSGGSGFMLTCQRFFSSSFFHCTECKGGGDQFRWPKAT
jgi:hypothetical protein